MVLARLAFFPVNIWESLLLALGDSGGEGSGRSRGPDRPSVSYWKRERQRHEESWTKTPCYYLWNQLLLKVLERRDSPWRIFLYRIGEG